MAFSRQCDHCKEHFPVKDIKQLDYYEADLGHYHTIHLCDVGKTSCAQLFNDWVYGKKIILDVESGPNLDPIGLKREGN